MFYLKILKICEKFNLTRGKKALILDYNICKCLSLI